MLMSSRDTVFLTITWVQRVSFNNGKVIVISSDSYEDADFEDYVVVAVLLEYLDLFAVLVCFKLRKCGESYKLLKYTV